MMLPLIALFPHFALAAPAPAPAKAEALQVADVFPTAPLSPTQAAALLSPEHIGPSARVYDQTTTTAGFVRTEEAAIEAVAFGNAFAPASDPLRRYTREYLSLLRAGRPHNRVEWFLAEHVGLATVPVPIGTFYTSSLDPASIGKLVASMVPRDDDLRSAAVAVERDEVHDVWVGVVAGLFQSATFEPFPRVHAPGGVAVIPGTLLAGDASYALYVTYPGTEVREFPLSGKGAFDVEVPLPSKPGVYRVAMNKQKKRQLPDSAFFFTLYVGEEPPASFPAVPPSADVPGGAGVEQDFLAQVNGTREGFGLPPLAWVDRTTELRTALASLPPYDRKVARWRYVRQVTEKDPLPGQAHGSWGPAFTDGRGADDAAWSAIEHPITRSTFLAPTATHLTAGALVSPNDASVVMLSFVIEPASDPLASRTAAFADLQTRYGSPSATAGQGGTGALQGKLDAIAAEVATGARSMKQGIAETGKEIKAAQKAGSLTGAAGWTIYAVPAGQTQDLSSWAPPDGAKSFAIGAANGDLGRPGGFDYTVLVIVAAGALR